MQRAPCLNRHKSWEGVLLAEMMNYPPPPTSAHAALLSSFVDHREMFGKQTHRKASSDGLWIVSGFRFVNIPSFTITFGQNTRWGSHSWRFPGGPLVFLVRHLETEGRHFSSKSLRHVSWWGHTWPLQSLSEKLETDDNAGQAYLVTSPLIWTQNLHGCVGTHTNPPR